MLNLVKKLLPTYLGSPMWGRNTSQDYHWAKEKLNPGKFKNSLDVPSTIRDLLPRRSRWIKFNAILRGHVPLEKPVRPASENQEHGRRIWVLLIYSLPPERTFSGLETPHKTIGCRPHKEKFPTVFWLADLCYAVHGWHDQGVRPCKAARFKLFLQFG